MANFAPGLTSFAVEEGLDPVRFFHMARGQALRDPRDTPVVSTHEGATGGFPKTVKHPRKPGIPTQIIERHLPEQLPKFLRKGASIDAGSSLQTQKVQRARGDDRKVCVIQGGEDGRVSIDLPGCLGEEVNLNDAGHIFVRDDRGAIALPKTL
ncbi:hypothetical protein, partial [Marivita sp.]|uniref:hypothetical protein n=1 Tax=Marivita sp. TaxID=2003365 RepID=UPI003F6EDF94